jgi:peptide/nickel transport system permease protein
VTSAPLTATGRRHAVRSGLTRGGIRLSSALSVLLAVFTLTFFGMRLAPGNPAEAFLGGPGAHSTAAQIAAVNRQYGFDRPLWRQYLSELGQVARGDLGHSYSLRSRVSTLIGDAVGTTLLLTALSLAAAWAIAIGLALWSTRGGRIAAAVGSGLEITAVAVPSFWLGSILILIFSVALGWLPPISTSGVQGLIMPVLTLALPLAGFLGQVMRESFLNALDSPFALSARARGESERGVRLIHALRHAALPGISLSRWAFGSLISGAVVVESLFSRAGLGRTMLNAVLVSDVPVVVGVVLVVALIYIVLTIVTESLERLIDPRLRQA